MSEVKSVDNAAFPPQFPVQGRLPSQPHRVALNLECQRDLEIAYHNSLCLAAGRRVVPPCCKTLRISLFFDGTSNNLNQDVFIAKVKHPTNIARLFRASIGAGYAGATTLSKGAESLLDADGVGGGEYFKYYMPGVGTPFPEVGDLDYTAFGQAAAGYGEERINWALLMLIDALKRSLQGNKLTRVGALVKAMGTPMFPEVGGAANRRGEFERQLKLLAEPLRIALEQPAPGHPKLLGLKLYVYGFSRGAAEARTFVKWLTELLVQPEPGQTCEPCLAVGELKLPVSIEYLGLLDTVASVGVAHAVPLFDGHMSWASGTQELTCGDTHPDLLKRCLHIVAAHEQRLCFPLDSIRRSDGQYPRNSVEVVHPGVHSDQGGGYTPGVQGKAIGKDDRMLLSQIALNDMYADAFTRGAPFKVPPAALPKELQHERWRFMGPEVIREFDTGPEVVSRFNAWRQLTLGLANSPDPLPDDQVHQYVPVASGTNLEEALRVQMGWITAWRIDRYAFDTLKGCTFYKEAPDKEGTPAARTAAEKARDAKQDEVKKNRRQAEADARLEPSQEAPPLQPGVQDYDPQMDQVQLREAAQEFGEDYRNTRREPTSLAEWALHSLPMQAVYLINGDDEGEEYRRMKAAGQSHVRELFPPPRGQQNFLSETERGEVDERLNADQPSGLLRALFDDQVHDSRAWFLHAKFGTREPWNSYFRERMVFFGSECNKPFSLFSVAGGIVGAAMIVGGVMLIKKQKGWAGKLAMAGALSQFDIIDLRNGLPLPMLANAADLQAPTTHVGALVAQQTEAIGALRLQQAQQAIDAHWETFVAQAREQLDAQV
ncbi:DUF2235 domain-containing protein [Pseudomonas sp. GD04087]|uniref:T6SS phospholipase effector Tle1-like catalytic domain-containing protein n=1 Tax=unclassified Pseudomonas TaxID=196821 RepID=UPI0024473F90|nr:MULTISPECIES: DUF2235 domain-containing protein [unclassified Pseudomonas]MDH0292895.1 DUF2235 domain-containing protein [Pseudomonas sp. GD04087]MDH1050029.1 DUF2235 domain-containing protein [Pseudomonas sp. GD03903]MDH2001881.1 DUF2235 domain-containing protein [Pseudomonas sp. GD03691]